MIQSSMDILLIVVAVSIGLLTVFACWGLYYFVAMLRDARKMTLSVREKMEIVDKILKLIHKKLEQGSNHMALIADSAIKLIGFLMEKQGEKKKSGRSRKKS